ncbi:MAG: T9SS type A sorting domain-containing protein [Bacteroidia bacterium]|nr:T9SS type A sorting domain-containing protein [Bacteroidia bacterium]
MRLTTKIITGMMALAGCIVFFSVSKADVQNGAGAPSGKTGSPGDGSSCTGCHGGTAPNVAGLISSDIPASGYVPGTVYTITASVSDPTKNKFGFQISPQSTTGTKLGTLAVTDAARTVLVGANKYITHTSTGNAGISNASTWSFNWTAPAAGSGNLSFYGAFLIANANGTTSGDAVKLSTLAVSENISSSIKENSLVQINVFPVPATDVLNVSFSVIPEKNVTLKIFSLKGELIKETVFENSAQKISMNVEDLSEGMYLLEIISGNEKTIKRFVKQN